MIITTSKGVRGGSFISKSKLLRSADRCWHSSGNHYTALGFRMTAQPAPFRVFRGGSWLTPVYNVRSTSRNRSKPGLRSASLGFRIVLQS